MYAYCNGNPVMYCDPSGQWAIWDFITGALDKVQGFFESLQPAVEQLGMFLGMFGEWTNIISSGFGVLEKFATHSTTLIEGFSRAADWFSSLFPKPSEDDSSLGGLLLNGIALLPSLMDGLEEFGRISTWVFQGMETVTYAVGNLFASLATILGAGSYGRGFDIRTNDTSESSNEGASLAPGTQAQAVSFPSRYLVGKDGTVDHASVAVGKQIRLYAHLNDNTGNTGNNVGWKIDRTKLEALAVSYTDENGDGFWTSVFTDVNLRGKSNTESTRVTAELWSPIKPNTRIDWDDTTVTVIQPVDNEFSIYVGSGITLRYSPLSNGTTHKLTQPTQVTICGEAGNWYYARHSLSGITPYMFVPKSNASFGKLYIPQDGNIGTFMAYMGYHKDKDPTAPIVRLREHARSAGRYSKAKPEYYAEIDGRIVIATKENIGGNFPVSIGDYVDVEFKVNGVTSIYNCIIGEEKFVGATDNPWGHINGKCVVEIVYHDYEPPAGYNANTNDPWGVGRVISITKVGSYGVF